MRSDNPTKLSYLIRVLHEIYLDYGDLDVKVFDADMNITRDAVVTLEESRDPNEPCDVVFLDKKALLQLPFEERR